MAKITTIGLDLAKHVFHIVCFDRQHHEVKKRMLKRRQVLTYFAQLQINGVNVVDFSSNDRSWLVKNRLAEKTRLDNTQDDWGSY